MGVSHPCKRCKSITTNGGPRCSDCNAYYNDRYKVAHGNKPATRLCVWHPYNTHRSRSGGHCGCCSQASSLVSSSKADDVKAQRPAGNITVSDVNAMQGQLCHVCLEPCYVLYDPETRPNPWCLSLDRMISGVSHDRETVRATHALCNVFRHDMDDVTLFKRLDHGHTFVTLYGGRIDAMVIDAIPISKYRNSNNRLFGVSLLDMKKSNAKVSGDVFVSESLTYDWLCFQYEHVQKGRCACCGDLLGDDISFDRTDPTNRRYVQGNVSLMHRNCNSGKNVWPLTEVHYMFLCSFRNRHIK